MRTVRITAGAPVERLHRISCSTSSTSWRSSRSSPLSPSSLAGWRSCDRLLARRGRPRDRSGRVPLRGPPEAGGLLMPASTVWTGILQIATVVLILALLYRPLGDAIARIYTSSKDWRIERGVY